MNHHADPSLPDQIPDPVGWKILVKPIEIRTTTAGGLELPPETLESLKYLRNVGQVIAMGPDCYSHPKFCESPPWCQVGDGVRFSPHAGAKEMIRGADGEPLELRYINDDEVQGRADSPDIWWQEL